MIVLVFVELFRKTITEFILVFKNEFPGTHGFPFSNNNLRKVKCQGGWGGNLAADGVTDVTDVFVVGGWIGGIIDNLSSVLGVRSSEL